MMRPDPSFGGVDAQAAFPRQQLEELTRTGAAHLRPIYSAMLDGGVAFLFVAQQAGRFGVEGRGGFVALIGDDTDCALGPKGFHAKSIRRLVRQVQSIAIIASDIEPTAYAASGALARMGFGTLIVETRPEQEAAWFETLKAAAPRTPIVLITPIAGNA